MSPEELVEKVAREISDVRGKGLYDGITLEAEKDRFRIAARAAVSIALEEAAKVFEQQPTGFWSGDRVAYDLRSLIPQDTQERIER